VEHQGYAMYNAANNTLEVIPPGARTRRVIRCAQIRPEHEQVHGVVIDGDAIRVYVGPYDHPRPTHACTYSFTSLGEGVRTAL